LYSIPTSLVDAAFRERLISHMQNSVSCVNFQEYADALADEAQEQCTSIATQIRVVDEQMQAALLSLTDPETPAVTRKALQTRYAQLDSQREELQKKLDTQKPFKRVQELLSYKEVIQRLAPQWEQLEFSDLKLLAEAAVEHITLDALSSHFCLFTIEWFDPTWGKEQAVLWRAYGRSPAWTDTELAIVAVHYPTMPQEELLKLLPQRSWKGIVKKAMESGVRREHNQRYTITNLHITMQDVQAMQYYGIEESQISSQNHVIWLETSLLPNGLPGQLS
jgi:outer membrane PBP1 activator LpoA protein